MAVLITNVMTSRIRDLNTLMNAEQQQQQQQQHDAATTADSPLLDSSLTLPSDPPVTQDKD